jgi:hypothetical protein
MNKLCPFKQPPNAACVEALCPGWDDVNKGCWTSSIIGHLAVIASNQGVIANFMARIERAAAEQNTHMERIR